MFDFSISKSTNPLETKESKEWKSKRRNLCGKSNGRSNRNRPVAHAGKAIARVDKDRWSEKREKKKKK